MPIWLGISLKMAQNIHFGSIIATNIETNKHLSKKIYLSAVGTSLIGMNGVIKNW